jgi:hypothetical protein
VLPSIKAPFVSYLRQIILRMQNSLHRDYIILPFLASFSRRILNGLRRSSVIVKATRVIYSNRAKDVGRLQIYCCSRNFAGARLLSLRGTR